MRSLSLSPVKSGANQRIRRRFRRVWVWKTNNPSWWTGLLFLTGSILFLCGSTSRLFVYISADAWLTRWLVLQPYALGSVAYTIGCAIPLQTTFIRWKRLAAAPHKRDTLDLEREGVLKQLHWAQVDFWGALVAVTGGLFINFACFVDVYLVSNAELEFTTDERVLWQVTLPTLFGRALFMIGGWLTWVARNHSASLFSCKNASGCFWWTSVLFWMGATLFYLGYFFTESPWLAPKWLVPNWFWVLNGYVVGSVCLCAASYIIVLELAAERPLVKHGQNAGSALPQ